MLVRRELVTKLLARKTPPKVAAVFVARVLTRDMYLLTTHNAMDTTAALLGIESAEVVAKLVSELPATGMHTRRCSPWRWSWAPWKLAHPRTPGAPARGSAPGLVDS